MGKGKGQTGSEETEALGTEKTAPCLGYSGCLSGSGPGKRWGVTAPPITVMQPCSLCTGSPTAFTNTEFHLRPCKKYFWNMKLAQHVYRVIQ